MNWTWVETVPPERKQASTARRFFHPLLFLLLPLLFTSCAAIREKNQAALLELQMLRLEKALRWHDYAQVARSLKREDGSPVAWTPPPEALRITAYETESLHVDPGATRAAARVMIDYYYADEPRLRRVAYPQRWWYDPESRRWWLEDVPPGFLRNP